MTKFKISTKVGKGLSYVAPAATKVAGTAKVVGHDLRQGYIEGKGDRLEARQIKRAEKAQRKAEAQAVKDLESQIGGITIDPETFDIAEVMPKLMKLVTENPKLAGLVGGDQS